MQTYEQQLASDPRWALSEGSRYFEEKSAVQDALRKITKRLAEIQIPYAVVGGMALFGHGYRRFTDDVDILVTREGLREIHRQLDGLGYVPPFHGSKNLRDTELGVKIEFLVAGQFPGDGKPKEIAFPEPSSVSINKNGIQYIALPQLIELKLASGMSDANRIRDIADVQELVKLLDLPREFAQNLNQSVRDKFDELWLMARGRKKRYQRLWRNKWLTADANNVQEMIDALRAAAKELEEMQAAGVSLDVEGGTSDDYAYLVTDDPKVAERFDMHDEDEFLDDIDDQQEADPS